MSMPRAKGVVGVRWEESTLRAESSTVAEAVLPKRRQASSRNQLAAWRCFAHPFLIEKGLSIRDVIPVELLVFPEVSTYLFYIIDRKKHVFISPGADQSN
eukprot:bmy_08513T0